MELKKGILLLGLSLILVGCNKSNAEVDVTADNTNIPPIIEQNLPKFTNRRVKVTQEIDSSGNVIVEKKSEEETIKQILTKDNKVQTIIYDKDGNEKDSYTDTIDSDEKVEIYKDIIKRRVILNQRIEKLEEENKTKDEVINIIKKENEERKEEEKIETVINDYGETKELGQVVQDNVTNYNTTITYEKLKEEAERHKKEQENIAKTKEKVYDILQKESEIVVKEQKTNDGLVVTKTKDDYKVIQTLRKNNLVETKVYKNDREILKSVDDVNSDSFYNDIRKRNENFSGNVEKIERVSDLTGNSNVINKDLQIFTKTTTVNDISNEIQENRNANLQIKEATQTNEPQDEYTDKIITEKEDIDYEVVDNNKTRFPDNEKKVKIKGEKGVVEKKYKIHYKNGEEISKELLDIKTIKEPKSELIATLIKTQSEVTKRVPVYKEDLKLYRDNGKPLYVRRVDRWEDEVIQEEKWEWITEYYLFEKN